MSTRESFPRAWRRADESFAKLRPSRELDLRVEASWGRARRGFGFLIGATALASAAITMFALSERPGSIDRNLAEFAPASCAPAEPRARLELEAGCRVEIFQPPLIIEAKKALTIERTKNGVRVLKGEVQLDVPELEEKVSVFVSGGRIELEGARFVVEEDGLEGRLQVSTGRIAFLAANGDLRQLEPGRTHVWGTKVAAPKTWSDERTAKEVARVSDYRARGEFDRAAALIVELLEAPIDQRSAEVLSFERGELLEHKLDRRADACAHWRAHAQRFHGGRYRHEIDAAIERCAGNSPSIEE